MRLLALITDPQQLRRILRNLVKTRAAPPGRTALRSQAVSATRWVKRRQLTRPTTKRGRVKSRK
jgi:hypothetical protein